MPKLILFVLQLILIASATSCKTNQIKNKQKTGHWVYTDTVNNVIHQSKGRYKRGVEKRTWNYYENGVLVKREKYKNGVCLVTTYHANGQIASQGKTKIVESSDDTNWYYTDDWLFYDETGKLIRIKNYKDGELSSDKKIL